MKTARGEAFPGLCGGSVLLVLTAATTFAAPPAALPAAGTFPADLRRRLDAAVAERGAASVPRTRHRNADGSPKYVNRLILEDSPYLQQHAHNPVDWYPWGDEAFAVARAKGKPVLLSIGYSTCHWCHVMEEESFDDEEIAALLNRSYVAVKVDRERRPDLDGIFLAAVQELTGGGGGWPMTVWLTPDRKPFYGGTYFPPRDGDRGVAVGFASLLVGVAEAYRKEPGRAMAAADEVVRGIERALVPRRSELARDRLAGILGNAAARYAARFDEAHGGFGGAPKFPEPLALQFLLREGHRGGDPSSLARVTKTLERMAEGGIRDHLGGGFHRYSTDRRWLVPHFEKMLYDNALLAGTYLEAFQATGNEAFAEVAREILRYVGREMTAPQGGFYSATDADSEGEEGKFFLWTPSEVAAVLGAERAGWFSARYGVTAGGSIAGKSVLHLAEPLQAIAARAGKTEAEIARALDEDRGRLREARARRVPPFRDTKILASWNGLMISAYARAAETLGDPEYAERAVRAATFVLGEMRSGGRLRRSHWQGRAGGAAYLDDYAFLEQGVLDLYQATFDPRWLREATLLQGSLDAHFRDPAGGGYFRTPDDGETVLVREKPAADGAEPSGNSVALLNCLRLAELTGDDRYRRGAEEILAAFGSVIERGPTAAANMLSGASFLLGVPKEIVIVRRHPRDSAEPMMAVLRKTFLPNRVVVVASEGADLEEQRKLVSLLEGKTALDGKVTAYVCERRVCTLPTTSPEVFRSQIVARDGK